MKVTEIQAVLRDPADKRSLKSLRAEEKIPGVIYGLDKNIHFAVSEKEVRKVIYTPHFGLVELHIEGKAHQCIVKDYQRHPVTDELVHVDLLALNEKRPIKVDIPVRFVGQSIGVKAGGTVVQKRRKVRIKTLPSHLVEEFQVDISNLDLGESVRVRDIHTDDDIEILLDPPTPLATIDIPRALKSATKKAADLAAQNDDDDAEGDEESSED